MQIIDIVPNMVPQCNPMMIKIKGVASAGKAGYTTFVIFTWFSFIAILAA